MAFPSTPLWAQQPSAGQTQSTGQRVQPAATATVNLSEIAEQEALNPSPALPSPSTATTFSALDDLGGGIIPPDVSGAAGTDRLLTMTNDRYRVLDKTGTEMATGTLLSFWTSVMPAGHTRVVYPRVVYDAIQGRWIVAAVSDDILAPNPFHVYNASVLVGVSKTGDPAGEYWLFRFDVDTTSFPTPPKFAAFPTLGFNKNWIAVGANLFTVAATPAYAGSQGYALDYPAARAGTATMTRFDFTGLEYAALQPALTHSATEETLYVLNYLGSGLPGTALTLPPGKTFTASLNAGTAGNAFDGNLTTQWGAGYCAGTCELLSDTSWGGPVWIEIDFGAPTQFSGITALVSQAPSGPTVHEVTLDGQPAFTWSVATSNGQPLSHVFTTPQTAQKVRITTTMSRSPVAWFEIGFQTSAGPGSGSYGFGTITGTPAAPVASLGTVKQLSALSDWTPPVGNMLPQKDTTKGIQGDPSLLGNVVFRNGHVYFAQTVGLPVGAVERAAVQWVKVDANGDFVDGGRIEDPTATFDNGGASYAYPSIAVNKNDDVLVGFGRFSSDTYASAAYAFRGHNDPAGTMWDPVVYKHGLGPYVRTNGSGSNRWGNYSMTTVDPTDDKTFWTVQEYAAASAGVADGDGRWGTWWAQLNNTPPTATSVTITGTPGVGQTLTGSYTYGDVDADAQGTSTFRWLRNGSAIAGATASTYTVVLADLGTAITFEVTPVAQTGASPGLAVTSAGVTILNSAPTATNLAIGGTLKVGQTLSGSYTYGDVDGNLEGASTFRWLRNGSAIAGATASTYTAVVADVGASITFEVTPVAQTGTSPGTPVVSPGVTILNSAPTATNLATGGTLKVGQTLTGSYTYADVDEDAQGTSTFRWLRGGAAIGGATASTYTTVAADSGQPMTFEVTPVAQAGASPGLAVTSAGVTIHNSAPTAANAAINGTPSVGETLTGSYTYADLDGDVQGTSTFRWLRDGSPIAGATALTYVVVGVDLSASIAFEVTPVAQAGVNPGTPVASAGLTIVGPPNTAPTMSDIGDQTLRVNFSTGALPFVVGDAEGAAGALTVTGTSSDQTIIPDANIMFGGSGADRTVTVTPVAGKEGTATITVAVSDATADARDGTAAPLTATDTFVVVVKALPYYMAEGVTGPFFDLELALANPTTSAAPVDILYLKKDGTTVNQSLTLGPQSRQTILVDGVPGLADVEVSSIVTSTSGAPLGVERTMTWDGTGYGSHTEKATQGVALTWYFAEGSEQAFFDTIVSLANPQATANRATVQFLVEGGSPVTKVYDLLPTSRTTLYAADVEEPAGTKVLIDKAFGITVTFDQPGVAERAMYFGSAPFWTGGHESAGVNAPSTSWFHAEGATGPFFDTYILLSNPNPTPATVTLRFLLDSGATVTRTKTVAANSRLTVGVEGEDPLLADAAMATQVTSDLPILSERAMYWAQYPNWYEAHNAFGVTATAPKWVLGEGRVGGPNGYETYILLANPGTTAATVTVTFLREGGLPPIVQTYPVAATSRFNVYANGVPGLDAGERFGAVIESTAPIAVERAMYSNASSQPGVFWAAGSDAAGAIIP